MAWAFTSHTTGLLLLVDRVFEGLTSGELHRARSCNLDGLTGAWITASAGCTLAGSKRSETNQLYRIALGHRLDDGEIVAFNISSTAAFDESVALAIASTSSALFMVDSYSLKGLNRRGLTRMHNIRNRAILPETAEFF